MLEDESRSAVQTGEGWRLEKEAVEEESSGWGKGQVNQWTSNEQRPRGSARLCGAQAIPASKAEQNWMGGCMDGTAARERTRERRRCRPFCRREAERA